MHRLLGCRTCFASNTFEYGHDMFLQQSRLSAAGFVLTHSPALLESDLPDFIGGFILSFVCSLIKGEDSVVIIK